MSQSRLAVGAGLLPLGAFVVRERRAVHPLLPLHLVLHRTRGAAIAAMFLSATGVFGILLFLTYYLQTALGYSPVEIGLAFLPMAATMIVVGGACSARLASPGAARAMVPAGLLAAGLGMAMLTRIGVEPHYVSTVLPATMVTGSGLGLVFAPCFNLGTAGVDDSDAGTASATLHVAQQIGGSVGTAMLNSVATAVAAHYLAAHPQPEATAHAAVHSYSVVFWIAAATFVLASVIVSALLRSAFRR